MRLNNRKLTLFNANGTEDGWLWQTGGLAGYRSENLQLVERTTALLKTNIPYQISAIFQAWEGWKTHHLFSHQHRKVSRMWLLYSHAFPTFGNRPIWYLIHDLTTDFWSNLQWHFRPCMKTNMFVSSPLMTLFVSAFFGCYMQRSVTFFRFLW